ncbi:phosphopantetheine-binding protein [Actinomadura fulvescens]|uniref:Carrier domain-containing protein n=1 Tax=Actinomadura fulvescens TaxID=46160 RepID=A0ABP6CYS5_9ACTN
MSQADLSAAITRALADHVGVAEFDVVSMGEDGSEVVAVVVPAEVSSAIEIREDLWAVADGLGHEVSPVVVAVAGLPAGGVDDAWLREKLAGSSSVSRYEPPATPLEEELASRMADVLGRPRVSVGDDFMELGGDSLTAVEFVTALQETHEVSVSVAELFGAGTVRRLTGLLEDHSSAA